MTHQRSSGSEEAKQDGQHTSTSTAAPTQPSQCCVFFAPKEWSRRYGEEFYTARITSGQQQSDGSTSLSIALRCADSEWSVQQPYSAFRQLATDVAAACRVQAGEDNSLPPLPSDKADVADMQEWMDSALQRKDVSRVAAVRHFLHLDTPIPRPAQQEQLDDSEDEQQTTVEGEERESKQTVPAEQ